MNVEQMIRVRIADIDKYTYMSHEEKHHRKNELSMLLGIVQHESMREDYKAKRINSKPDNSLIERVAHPGDIIILPGNQNCSTVIIRGYKGNLEG